MITDDEIPDDRNEVYQSHPTPIPEEVAKPPVPMDNPVSPQITEAEDDDILHDTEWHSPEEEAIIQGEVDDVTHYPEEDEQDILEENPVSNEPIDDEPVEEASLVDPNTSVTDDADVINYPEDKIDFRGEPTDWLIELVKDREEDIGATALDARTRSVGTWENLIFRAILDTNFEEIRIQEAFSKFSKEELSSFATRFKDENGKTLLRTSSIARPGPKSGEVKSLSGEEALLAFENSGTKNNKGGGYRIPLYNSGITVDVIVPTGVDVQTMLTNCLNADRELGSSQGAHYFTYSDQMYKSHVVSFIQSLIINSSYTDWRKNGKLWSVIKLPDLQSLVMNIAAICYKDGFDGFMTKCTRNTPSICGHTETVTANLFNMIVTRFAALSKESVDFMVQARIGKNKNNLTQIAGYQALLGFEGERITIDDITFTMRIPTVSEHMAAGAVFLADVTNEIEADNNEGRLEQLGFRYLRTFLPWVATVEITADEGGTIKTSDSRVIVRALEKIDKDDAEDKLRNALRAYIDKVQLTYVGYPVTECPACGYMAETPSGMWTFDPFSVFFTLAFLYLNPKK